MQNSTIDEQLMNKLKQFTIIDEEINNNSSNKINNSYYSEVNQNNVSHCSSKTPNASFKVINNKKIAVSSNRSKSPSLINERLSKHINNQNSSKNYSTNPRKQESAKNSFNNYSNVSRSKSKSKNFNSNLNKSPSLIDKKSTNPHSKYASKQMIKDNPNYDFGDLYYYNNIREQKTTNNINRHQSKYSNFNNSNIKVNSDNYESSNTYNNNNYYNIPNNKKQENETINLNLNLNINKNQFDAQDIRLVNNNHNHSNSNFKSIKKSLTSNYDKFVNNRDNLSEFNNENLAENSASNFTKNMKPTSSNIYNNQIPPSYYNNSDIDVNNNKLENDFLEEGSYLDQKSDNSQYNKYRAPPSKKHSFSNFKTLNLEKVPNYYTMKKKINKINKINSINQSPESKIKMNNNANDYSNNNKKEKYISLYEDFKRIKSKIETKKHNNDRVIQRSMSPNITKMAQSIRRDPNTFQERLYPYHKIAAQQSANNSLYNYQNYGDNIEGYFHNKNHLYKVLDENDAYDIYGNKINHDSIYHKSANKLNHTTNNDLSFTPIINSRSEMIASRLEPSYVRLTANKRSKSKTSVNSNNNSFINYSYANNKGTKVFKKSSTGVNSQINSPGRQLYERGLNSLKKKILNYEIKCQEMDDINNEFDFRPNILPSSRLYIESNLRRRNLNRKSNDDNSNTNRDNSEISNNNLNNNNNINNNSSNISKNDEMYDRNINWKMHLEQKLSKSKERLSKETNKECTFTPDISHINIPTDHKIIQKNLSGIYEYVMRRRTSLSRDKAVKEFYDRKFNNGRNHQIKPTKPIDVTFEIDKRIALRKSNLKPQALSKNVHSYRDLTKSSSFFLNPENNNYAVFNNMSNHSFQKTAKFINNQKSEINNHNKKFVSAVNSLSGTLNNFKI